MSASFDPYHVWLGIPPEEQPPSRYRLLGVRAFEAMPDVIDNAADRQTAHLRTLQTGQHVKLAERLLNEIAAARICLLDPTAKAKYDQQLRAAASQAVAAQTAATPAAASAIRRSTMPAPGGEQDGVQSPQAVPEALRTAQTLTTARPLAAAVSDENWDALIGDSAATQKPGQKSERKPGSGPQRRRKSANPKLLGGGVALLLAIATVAAALVLISPQEAVLSFDWPAAERAGASLVVDDQPVAIPASGSWEYHCQRGTHRIFAKRPAYKWETTETLAAGERKTLTANWRPKATLGLNWPLADRADATLLIDNVSQPPSQQQPEEIALEPGRHVVRVTRRGAEPFEVALPIENDERQKVTVVLPVEPTLVIDWPAAERQDATLTIDGAPAIVDPTAATLEWSLKSGEHTIRITRPGFQPIEQTATLVAGSATPLALAWQTVAADTNPSTGNPVPAANPSPATDIAANAPPAAPELAQKKLNPPLPAEQERIAKELDDIYKVTHNPAKDRPLVAEMLKAAGESGSSPAEQFMLLKKGALLAAEMGDFESAFQAVDALADSYQIDAFAAKQSLLKGSMPAVTTADQVASLVAAAELLITEAIAADQYDAALAIIASVKDAIARRPSDFRMFKDAEEQLARHRRDIAALQTSWAALEAARQTLAKHPADADANLALGRWYCLLKRDWPRGLPFLAKASDERLSALAKIELAGNLDANGRNQLADGWWDRAQKETDLARDGARQHAADLYRLVLPSVQSPLKKAAIEQRLAAAVPALSAGTSAKGISGEKRHWTVIFLSAVPEIWNTDTADARGTAVSIEKVPRDIKFLKMKLDRNRFVIIAMAWGNLGGRPSIGRYSWLGDNRVDWGGRQLGIVDLANPKNNAGEIIMAYVDPQTGGRSGWGFGYRAQVNDQGFAWEGQPADRPTVEISVTAGELNAAETKHLLK